MDKKTADLLDSYEACPNCESNHFILVRDLWHHQSHDSLGVVYCDRCGEWAPIRINRKFSNEMARDAWNKRVQELKESP